jgi:serine/threonine-protein kinase
MERIPRSTGAEPVVSPSPEKRDPSTAAAGRAQRLGAYEVLAEVGQGGMGAVFKARQLSIGRLVALKVLPQRLAQNAEFRERFLCEARAAARLNHPNIVHVYDTGSAGGYSFIAMEFVEGRSAAQLLAERGPLPERGALRIARDVAAALDHAHRRGGIIHRDVKPENILVDADGVPKLADLGVAREATRIDGGLTRTGVAIGTPHYMAPEQIRGERELDGRADVYSLGVTLFHLLTGSRPYRGGSGAEVLSKHLTEPMPDPRSIRPDISSAAATIVLKATAKERDDRYPSALAMLDDIGRALAGEAPLASPPPRDAGQTDAGRSGGRLAAVALALLIALTAGGAALYGNPDWLRSLRPGPKPSRPAAGTTSPPGATSRPASSEPARVATASTMPVTRDLAKEHTLFDAARSWALAHPEDLDGAIARYERLDGQLRDPVLRTRARDALDDLRRRRARAVDDAWITIHQQATRLARAGDYDAAIRSYGRVPARFSRHLRARADAEIGRIRAQARARIEPVLAAAKQLARNGRPQAGLDRLDTLKDVRYDPLDAVRAALRRELEAAVKGE